MFPGVPIEYYYPALALLLLGLVVLFVPRAEFRKLFWLAFLWGYVGSKIFIVIISDFFHLIKWKHAMPFEFLGAPHWLVFGWGLSMMIYFSCLPKSKVWYAFPTYLFIFALASAALDKIFNNLGLLEYVHWNPFYRFILAAIWFYGAAWHYNYLESKGKL
ncbi:MAG TPA: hypothetical protein DDW65_05090 [Firmicutes bacterium]|jgi:hypothetical protein|nr:hypothetical protein [Bacillota bacterium]